MRDVGANAESNADRLYAAGRKTRAPLSGTASGTALAASSAGMVTHAATPSAVTPSLRAERLFASVTLALLLCCVFDVTRAMYYRMLLNYSVTSAARVLTRTTADATDLVRRLSGVRDVHASLVRLERAPPALMVTARYDVPLISPPLWPLFGRGTVSLEAVGVAPVSAPQPRDS